MAFNKVLTSSLCSLDCRTMARQSITAVLSSIGSTNHFSSNHEPCHSRRSGGDWVGGQKTSRKSLADVETYFWNLHIAYQTDRLQEERPQRHQVCRSSLTLPINRPVLRWRTECHTLKPIYKHESQGQDPTVGDSQRYPTSLQSVGTDLINPTHTARPRSPRTRPTGS